MLFCDDCESPSCRRWAIRPTNSIAKSAPICGKSSEFQSISSNHTHLRLPLIVIGAP